MPNTHDSDKLVDKAYAKGTSVVGSAPTNNSVVLHDLQLFCVHGGQTSSHLMAKKAMAITAVSQPQTKV
jgi:hypothetical protein